MNIKKLLLLTSTFILIGQNLFSNEHSFRKYEHVKKFYKSIYKDAIDVGLKHNIPPAAIMAIAGLESGYGSGYVSQITGNILSLGAFKGDAELPSLYLPYSLKDKKVLFILKDINSYDKKDLVYKQRSKSLKRDYRPKKYAGSIKNLELLTYDKALKKEANLACLNDFTTRWISISSKVNVFKNARIYLNGEVKKKTKDILLDKKLNVKFINMIGGHKHSFNYRSEWPKKVVLIMNKVGLCELVKDIYKDHKNFNDAWSN